jgi:hypothetical protein
MRFIFTFVLILSVTISVLQLFGCSASNCPLENTVTCNYGFYDSEGNPVRYNDTLTVSTLLPGLKTVYIYRQLGYLPVTLDHQDSSYISKGYSESKQVVRRDTILINKLSGGSSISLPMQYYSHNDTIIFSYSSISNKDTLYIQHDSYSYVDLPECGTHRFHTITGLRTTYSGISQVELTNPRVNYDGKENIKIYFNGTAE